MLCGLFIQLSQARMVDTISDDGRYMNPLLGLLLHRRLNQVQGAEGVGLGLAGVVAVPGVGIGSGVEHHINRLGHGRHQAVAVQQICLDVVGPIEGIFWYAAAHGGHLPAGLKQLTTQVATKESC